MYVAPIRDLVTAAKLKVIKEVRDQIIEFCRAGRAVKGDGLGTFTPTIDLQGYFAISFRADSAMNCGLNVPGTILNREFIGKTGDELIARWNPEHADDQVNFAAN